MVLKKEGIGVEIEDVKCKIVGNRRTTKKRKESTDYADYADWPGRNEHGWNQQAKAPLEGRE